MNAANPKYRNRGNPYDLMTEDEKKTQDRVERLQQRIGEEDSDGTANSELQER